MRKYIVLILSLFVSINSFCQTGVFQTPVEMLYHNYYDGDTVEEFGSYRLHLGDNQYLLELYYTSRYNWIPSWNDTASICYSYGKYSVDGNKISMLDTLNGFDMQAIHDGKGNFVFEKGFVALSEKAFSYYQPFDDSYVKDKGVYDVLSKNDMDDILSEREQYRKSMPFRRIKYGFHNSSFTKLNLMENGRYSLFSCLERILISSGSWSVDGRLLVMQDDGLDKPFYALVDSNFLKAKFFPYSIDDWFEYVKYDPSEEEKALPAIRGDSIFAQFSVDMPEHTYISIVFSENEYYMSQAVGVLNDVVMIYEPSYGGFIRKGNMLYLTDSVCGFDMQFELSDDTTHITQRRGFSSLNGKDLAFEGKAWGTAPVSFDRDIEADRQMFDAYASQSQLHSYDFGRYFFRSDIELHLYDDGNFTYLISETVFLEGKAYRNGNLLILKDNIIEEPFHALIEEDGIVPILPGLYGRQKAKVVFE